MAPKKARAPCLTFHPKTHKEIHNHTQTPSPKRQKADLFTPINIPSEEEGKQILSLHLCALMFARCSLLFPPFFLSTGDCQHKQNPLCETFFSFKVLLSSTPSLHTPCVCCVSQHIDRVRRRVLFASSALLSPVTHGSLHTCFPKPFAWLEGTGKSLHACLWC